MLPERFAVPPLHRPHTCHTAAVDVMNSSSSAYPIRPIRPERFAVPHHRLLGQPSYRRAAAGMVIPRRFSSLSVDEDAVPPHLVKLPPLEGEVIHPYKGVIRADLGQFRPLTVEGVSVKNGLLVDGIELDKPRLPLVRQISFHEAKDIHLTQWETPMSYLNRCPAIRPAGMYNPLLHQPDKLMMLTPYGRTLWKSAVDLICVNRARGYCISRALFEENLVVSSLHGTFGLSRPIADDLPENPMDFVGFKALKRLFVSLMVRRYGQAAFDLLLPDVLDWLEVLDNPAASFEELPEYHGCLLPDEGRAWLGVRIAQIFTNELEDIIKEFACSLAFQRLYPLSEGIDELHSFFEEWHRHARAMRTDKEKDLWALVEPDISPEELEQWKVESEKWKVNTGGRWIIMMHRHGFLHSHSYRLSKLARRRYTSKHVVDLMHCKLPMYLPAVQSICGDLGIWGRLDMRRCFPKPVTYPVLDLDKMKMKATCYPVI